MKQDKELEEFRSAMEVPSTFEDGFNWTSLLGALFIGMVMVPGAMYMGLLAGQGINQAAQWVTVILFIEVARRAQKDLNKSEVFVLFYMAGAAMGTPFGGLLWNQFFVRSKAVISEGIAEDIPMWFAPQPGSPSYEALSFFHLDWLPVIGFVIFQNFMGQISAMVLGYGFFRLASDIEKLPFPMAPIGAQGIVALAEDTGKRGNPEEHWRWRIFAIGGAIGLAFGFIYLGIPTLGNALVDTAVTILPIPFSDWTSRTQEILPAVATGMDWNLGNVIIGMVLPFFAMLGSFIGLLVTFILNPILYNADVLTTWKPGDDTIKTLFYNNIDFYFSFTIGISIAVALFGFWQVYVSIKDFRAKRQKENQVRSVTAVPPGRGDIPAWGILVAYFLTTMSYILVSGWLIDWHSNVMLILLFFGFVYTPIISYVTARLEGIAGQVVEIPMIKEAALILSGYKGVKIWFLPIPIHNYGDNEVVFYRKCELTGTSFWSIWKTKLVLFPIILISSIFFANFIWSQGEIPSGMYPFAEKWWELQAANATIMYTSTLGQYSLFEEAFSWNKLFAGTGAGVVLFAILSKIGAPIFLIYGVVRGLGQTLPHSIIPQFLGALLAHFYFRRRLGLKWRQYAPVLAAGFACGMGLIGTFGIGITFLSGAIIKVPF